MVASSPKSMVAAVLYTLTFASVLASAQKLRFKSPIFDAVQGQGLPYFSEGQYVTISWATEFENTTLSVLQLPPDRIYRIKLLAASYPTTATQVIWKAEGIDGAKLDGSEFHFFLQNAANYQCSTCYLNSDLFKVQPAHGAEAASSSASAGHHTAVAGHHHAATTKMPAAATRLHHTSQSSASSQRPTRAAAGAKATDTTSPTEYKHHTNLAVPLGVGLGVGLAVLLLLIALLLLWFMRRKKEKRGSQSELVDGNEKQMTPASSGSNTWSQDARMRQSAESGALGPWGRRQSYDDIQSWGDQEHWGGHPPDLAAASEARRRASSQKYDHTPFRPSMAATAISERSTGSRQSYFDPFEFEQPGTRDADELSQIRTSIRNAPTDHGDARSYHSDRYSGFSFGEHTDDVPAVPQPAHQQENWPLRY